MEKLWAPWRMEYIKGPQQEGCILCDMPAAGNDAEHLILFRGKYNYVIMNLYPYSNGHLMIAPFAHVADYADLDGPTLLECSMMTQEALRCLRAAFSPDGVNVGLNLGRVAGAGILDHVHLHVVPRWQGDTNFMPVLSETKVISEHVRSTYEQLRPYFEKISVG
jgi:ATP adenylyltransferase